MADKIGKVTQRDERQECVVEWKIRNFFELSAKVDKAYYSPSFSFANAYWCLTVYPNGAYKDMSEGYINVYLHRESSGPPISFEYTLGLKTVNEYTDPLKKYSYIFEKRKGYGTACFLERTELLERKSELAPRNAVTMVCALKYPTHFKATGEKNISGSSTILPKSKLLQDFKELYLKQENCDVVLRVKEAEFSAHKAILQARSPVFASTFLHDMKEKATGIVQIDDCDPSVFRDFLCFLYCEDMEDISKESVISLFTVADKYDVPDLRSKCVEFMKENISVDTFCDTITLAVQHSESDLIHLATDFFIQNADKIIVTVRWQVFAAENPTQSNELFIKFVASIKHPNVSA